MALLRGQEPRTSSTPLSRSSLAEKTKHQRVHWHVYTRRGRMKRGVRLPNSSGRKPLDILTGARPPFPPHSRHLTGCGTSVLLAPRKKHRARSAPGTCPPNQELPFQPLRRHILKRGHPRSWITLTAKRANSQPSKQTPAGY
jgi:hypothetical protein